MVKEVTLKISPDGSKVEADAEGFVGGECTEFMEPVMKALGDIEKLDKKPEYFQTTGSGITTKA